MRRNKRGDSTVCSWAWEWTPAALALWRPPYEDWVWGQPGLHSEARSQTNTQTNKQASKQLTDPQNPDNSAAKLNNRYFFLKQRKILEMNKKQYPERPRLVLLHLGATSRSQRPIPHMWRECVLLHSVHLAEMLRGLRYCKNSEYTNAIATAIGMNMMGCHGVTSPMPCMDIISRASLHSDSGVF